MTDTDTMQAELEAAGYEIYLSQNPLRKNSWVCFDGWYFEISDIGLIIEDNHDEDIILDMLVTKAYEHLQQQRELATLRTLFDLCVRTFDYPREVEMLGAGLTDAERAMLYQAFETRRKELDTHTEDNTDE